MEISVSALKWPCVIAIQAPFSVFLPAKKITSVAATISNRGKTLKCPPNMW